MAQDNVQKRVASSSKTPAPGFGPAYDKTLPGTNSDVGLAATVSGASASHPTPLANSGAGELAAGIGLIAVPGSVPVPLQKWEHYEIIRPIGQGGMGTVFLARDRRLGRMVALKFLRVPSPDAAERMMQEARAQARLDHNGICKVFEVGEFQGQPYIAMEYLDGHPLHLALRRLSLDQKVVLLYGIALAVHAAHRQGILHRDLKPANIMVCQAEVGAEDASPCGLRPVLMDFGLARDSLGPQRLTQTGVIMGTPHYMAPEQARGQARHLDRRADVYSLGAMFYEMLVGRPPFDAENEVELILAVLQQDPQPPRQIDASIPLDLEIIALKCLHKEPEQRYESALALAEDLQRYLQSEPIVARPASTLYRLRRMALRHRMAVVVAAVLLFSLGGLFTVMLRARTKVQQASARGEVQKRLAAELGQTVSHMNLFLRVAYSLPVHDLPREQNLVRQRLGQLEQQMGEVDPFLHGTLQSALGQGYLALHEYPRAISHLRLALSHGVADASVHLALGQALGGLYQQKASELRRQLNGAQTRTRLEPFRQSLLVPAQKELQLAHGTEAIPPSYVQALLHYYSGDAEYEQALKKTRQAQKEAPWLIEPVDLETKILTERYAERLRQGDHFALSDRIMVRDALEKAIGIARSYPEFYNTFVDYSIITIRNLVWSHAGTKGFEEFFSKAAENAEIAAKLQPNHDDALDQWADVYASWAYVQAYYHQDPEPAVKPGLEVIAAALRHKPERSRTYTVSSRMYIARNIYEEFLEKDSMRSAEQATKAAQRAAELDSTNFESLNLLAIALFKITALKRGQGQSADAEELAAINAERRALELRPDVPLLANNLAQSYIELADRQSAHGLDGNAALAQARKIVQDLQIKTPDFGMYEYMQFSLLQSEVRALLKSHHDALAPAQRLFEMAKEIPRKYSQMPNIASAPIHTALLLAQALQESGKSPLAVIDDTLSNLASLQDKIESKATQLILKNSLLLQKAQFLAQNRQSPLLTLDAILAATADLSTQKGTMRTELMAQRAKAFRLRGDFLKEQKRTVLARTAVAQGLETCAEARQTGRGDFGAIQIEEGVLGSLQAQLFDDFAERQKIAQKAVTSLQQVLAQEPPLERELEPYLQAALQIAGTSPRQKS